MHNVLLEFYFLNILPTEAKYAAAADVTKESITFTKGKKNTLGLVDIHVRKRQTKGDQLANFKQGNGDYGGIAGWSDDADITNEVKKIPCK
jgi:hypothetical protein